MDNRNKKFIYIKYFRKIRAYRVLIFFLFFLSFVKAASSDVPVSLTIDPGNITIGAPQYLNLGQINLSQTEQEIQGQFNNYFWVEDLMGSSTGYSTNIVCAGLVGPNGANLTGIYLMAGNNGMPDLIAGASGDVAINSVFSGDYYSIYSTPVTYIYKPQQAGHGTAEKYGDKPWIKVIIPAYIQPGTYSGTIYFDI